MNNLKLKHKILLSFIVAITITVAALSTINLKTRLYEDSEILVASLSEREGEKIRRWFDVRKRMLAASLQLE